MCEVLIIGSGLAGLSAAITCAEQGKKAVIISSQPSWCSQSVLAAGGINAALNNGNDEDSVTEHEKDTWEAGCCLADREAVHNLACNAPSTIRFLEECGVVFSREEDGRIAQRYFGGQKKKRTCYANAGIGKQLVSGLEQRIRYYENRGLIRLLDHHIFLDIIKEQNEIRGVLIFDRFQNKMQALEGPVIVASGGMSGLFGRTTGALHSDGSVTAAVYMAGVKMANLEMIQYHPTTIMTKSKSILISEAARGEGGRLFTYRKGEKWYFCEEWYGEHGNLMSRDVVSRAIDRVLKGGEADNSKTVWLDLTQLDSVKVENKLLEVCSVCEDYLNLNPVKEPIPVVPGIHYFMGGIWVDIHHRTSMKGLYAAGECCSQYHGANRLGGNSTLGAVYGGQCAAISCCQDYDVSNAKEQYQADESNHQISDMTDRLKSYSLNSDKAYQKRNELQEIMRTSMGIIRNGESLMIGKDKLSNYIDENKANMEKKVAFGDKSISLIDIYSYQTNILSHLGKAMIQSALERKESRGAHYRLDYPDTEEQYTVPTYITYQPR